jgi:hypothetical protein
VNVGRDEGEGKLRVALVFCEVKADAAHHVPDRVLLLQIAPDSFRVPGRRARQGLAHVGPQLAEELRRDQLGARHGRRVLDECRDIVGIRVGNDQGLRIGRIERTAYPGHKSFSDVAPVRQCGGKVGARLRRTQIKHSFPAAGFEGVVNPLLRSSRDRRTLVWRSGADVDAPARHQPAGERAAEAGGGIKPKLCHSLFARTIPG